MLAIEPNVFIQEQPQTNMLNIAPARFRYLPNIKSSNPLYTHDIIFMDYLHYADTIGSNGYTK